MQDWKCELYSVSNRYFMHSNTNCNRITLKRCKIKTASCRIIVIVVECTVMLIVIIIKLPRRYLMHSNVNSNSNKTTQNVETDNCRRRVTVIRCILILIVIAMKLPRRKARLKLRVAGAE